MKDAAFARNMKSRSLPCSMPHVAIGGGMGVVKGPWLNLNFGGRSQRILWPHLNFGQIFTKIDLTLMIICEKRYIFFG